MADTIFALSSGRGRSGIAVIRVSGSEAGAALQALGGGSLPKPRLAARRNLAGANGDRLDDALVLWFPAPGSFTGEDVTEFHVHGGRAVVESVLDALGFLPGLRPAEPGEFTRRAVENGKFDLTQAEALADLINAETDAQRRQALRQYDGALGKLYEGWRTQLIRAAAWIEAAIDFSDEEIPSDSVAQSKNQIAEILSEIQSHLNDARRGEILCEGFHLTVIGPPNSGKSSLINALARRDVAIVSDLPGTTRDILEVRLDLVGYPVIVADTAGLREAGDQIEAEGVRRALARADKADAVLLLLDATQPAETLPSLTTTPALTAYNKADLPHPANGGLLISVRTGEGIETLIAEIGNIVSHRLDAGGAPSLSRERHRHALRCTTEALHRALSAEAAEIVAEEIRLAMGDLGRITGRVGVEDLLDVVFKDFCIGK